MSLPKFLNFDPEKIKKKAEEEKKRKEIIERKVPLVRNFVKTKLKADLEDFIKNNNWFEPSELCINLLNNTLTNNNKKYIKDKLGISELNYHKDVRTPELYALELFLSWIIEDVCVILFSKEPEIKCTLNENRDRKFLPNPKLTYDINLQYNSKKIPIEIKQDYNEYYKTDWTIGFKDYSYEYLSKNNVIVFGIDFINNQIVMIDINTTKNRIEYIENYETFGGKFLTGILLNKDDFCSWNNWKIKFINILRKRSKRLKENG